MNPTPITFERRTAEANRQAAVINEEIAKIRKECPGAEDRETERKIRRLLIQRNWVYVELSRSRDIGDRRKEMRYGR